MEKIHASFLYVLLIIQFSKSEVKMQYYQRQFTSKSLTSAYNVLFSGDGNSFSAALKECTEFCRGDRRCIGMEVCRIREDMFRCRVCCEWTKLGESATFSNDMIACTFFERVENTMNIAIGKPVSLSSSFSPDAPNSNAVDNIIDCQYWFNIAHTQLDFRPWLQIDLQAIYDVYKTIIYNRQDCCGERLHDVQIDIKNNRTEASCGFYEGPAGDEDRIVVICAPGARGRYVQITIMSHEGTLDTINICEVQVIVGVQLLD